MVPISRSAKFDVMFNFHVIFFKRYDDFLFMFEMLCLFIFMDGVFGIRFVLQKLRWYPLLSQIS